MLPLLLRLSFAAHVDALFCFASCRCSLCFVSQREGMFRRTDFFAIRASPLGIYYLFHIDIACL
jgi:hypothetical protein